MQEGSSIGNRYNLVNLLGQGTFGKVVRARDNKNREFAVKIIRAVPKVLSGPFLRLNPSNSVPIVS